jgi:hypothetical protein
MPTIEDRQNIRKQVMNMIYKGRDLGYLKPDSLKVRINGRVQTAEVDQIAATIVKAVLNGFAPEVEVTLMRTDQDFIGGVLLEGMVGYKAGTNGPEYGFGNPEVDMDLIAGELLLVPKNNAAGVRTNSVRIPLCYPTPETLELAMGKNNFQELVLRFVVLPDVDADLYFQMMSIGNIDAEGSAPLGVFLQTSTPFRTGVKSLTAITLTKFEKQLIQVYRIDGTPSGTTALANGAITSGDTSIVYDNASQNNPFVIGQVVRIGSELYDVVSVTPATLTTGTIGVIPAAYGTTQAGHADNSTIEILKNVYRVNFTQQAAWASGNITAAIVGNVAGALDDTRKGLISHGGTPGTANIVATIQAVASPNLVVTAA